MSNDEADAANLTAKERALLGGESLVYAVRVTRASHGSTSLDNCLVVLTGKRLIASKQKLFGTPKADMVVPWTSVHRCSGDQWMVDPTQVVLEFETDFGPFTIIDKPTKVYEIETRGRSIYRAS